MRNISSQGVLFHKMLSECSAGGVRLVSGNERITIDNTLDERLHLLEEQVRYHHTVRESRILLTPIHRCYLRSALIYSDSMRIASSILKLHV